MKEENVLRVMGLISGCIVELNKRSMQNIIQCTASQFLPFEKNAFPLIKSRRKRWTEFIHVARVRR